MWERLNAKPVSIFLIDAAGALVTALLLRFVLTPFEHLFGMPRTALTSLTIIAFVYSLYSFTCYFVARNWSPYVQLIALANLAYCLITLGLMLFHYRQITLFGVVYLVGEIVVIASLAGLEWRLATKKRR